MLLIGLLIVIAAVVFGAVEVAQNWGGTTYTIKGFGNTLGHFTLAEIFLAGIVLAVIFFAGLWMVSVSSRVHRRAAKQRKIEARDAAADREAAIADRDRLAGALQRERTAHNADLNRDRDAVAQPVETTPEATTVPVVERPVVYNSTTQTYETAGALPGSIDVTDPQPVAVDDAGEPVVAGSRHRRRGLLRS